MNQELRKLARVKTPEPPAKPVDPPAKSEDAAAKPDEGSKPGDQPAKPDDKPGDKKVNPWKLLDETKAARAKAEQELAQLRKLMPDEAARKAEIERLAQVEQRAKELEEHMRFVDYSKTKEFSEQYQKPYEQAWSKAMSELKELTIEDPGSGETRYVQPQDLLEIVNMPLGKARELADAKFGVFADDVMAHRKEIKGLFDKQAAALDEARKNGADRERRAAEEFFRGQGELRKQIAETWNQANEAVMRDEKYSKFFTPVEGDEQGNQRLAKGFELVDRAFSENPANPKLSTEERAAIVKRHSAVRHRAAAFGRLVYQNSTLSEENAKLKRELEQFSGTVPITKGGDPASASPKHLSAREEVFGALRKLAK
jgi:hypothetical protein